MAWKTAIVFGCTHMPFSDKKYCDWLIDKVGEVQPDVLVCNGDLFDQAGLSKFAKHNVPTLEAEYQAANQFIQRLNELHDPTVKKSVMNMGNHCSRCLREEYGTLSSLLDYRKHVSEMSHWDTSRQYRRRVKDTFQFGQVTIYHGFEVSQAGIKREATNLATLGGLVIGSHTHRGMGPTMLTAGGNLPIGISYCNTGCGISDDVQYFQTWNVSEWNRGLVLVNANTERRNRNTPFWNAEFIEHSRFV